MSENDTLTLTGVAYVLKLENEYLLSHKLAVCNNCLALGFEKVLRRCIGCQLAAYCSKECQKQHWSRHRRFCNLVQGKGKKNAYLSGLKREDIIQMLIDSYRLRVETDHLHRQEDHGIYYSGTLASQLVWADGDVYADFQRYLDQVEMARILPIWWSFEDRMECLASAVDQSNDESVFQKIDQEKLLTRYAGDTTIRSALCVLAELAVGYDGKGPTVDNTWVTEFQEFLDSHPEERARLMSGTVAAVKAALKSDDGTLAATNTGPDNFVAADLSNAS